MALSFVYLAFVSLLRLLVRCGRTVDVKDIELLVLRRQLVVLGRVGFANSASVSARISARLGSAFLLWSREGSLALVVRVSRCAEPVRAGVAVGALASVEGAGDLVAAPRVGRSAASVDSAKAEAG